MSGSGDWFVTGSINTVLTNTDFTLQNGYGARVWENALSPLDNDFGIYINEGNLRSNLEIFIGLKNNLSL